MYICTFIKLYRVNRPHITPLSPAPGPHAPIKYLIVFPNSEAEVVLSDYTLSSFPLSKGGKGNKPFKLIEVWMGHKSFKDILKQA